MRTLLEQLNGYIFKLENIKTESNAMDSISTFIQDNTSVLENVLRKDELEQEERDALRQIRTLFGKLLFLKLIPNTEIKSNKKALDLIEEISLINKNIETALVKKIPDFALHIAASKGDIAEVQELISKGIAVDIKNERGQTAGHIAASTGDMAILEKLWREGANLDARDHRQQTLLHEAAYANRVYAVHFLLTHDADPDAKDQYGQTADQVTDSILIIEMIEAARRKKALEASSKKAQSMITADVDITREAIIEASKIPSGEIANPSGLTRNKDEVRSQGLQPAGQILSEKRSVFDIREHVRRAQHRSPGSNAEFGPEPTISGMSSPLASMDSFKERIAFFEHGFGKHALGSKYAEPYKLDPSFDERRDAFAGDVEVDTVPGSVQSDVDFETMSVSDTLIDSEDDESIDITMSAGFKDAREKFQLFKQQTSAVDDSGMFSDEEVYDSGTAFEPDYKLAQSVKTLRERFEGSQQDLQPPISIAKNEIADEIKNLPPIMPIKAVVEPLLVQQYRADTQSVVHGDLMLPISDKNGSPAVPVHQMQSAPNLVKPTPPYKAGFFKNSGLKPEIATAHVETSRAVNTARINAMNLPGGAVVTIGGKAKNNRVSDDDNSKSQYIDSSDGSSRRSSRSDDDTSCLSLNTGKSNALGKSTLEIKAVIVPINTPYEGYLESLQQSESTGFESVLSPTEGNKVIVQAKTAESTSIFEGTLKESKQEWRTVQSNMSVQHEALTLAGILMMQAKNYTFPEVKLGTDMSSEMQAWLCSYLNAFKGKLGVSLKILGQSQDLKVFDGIKEQFSEIKVQIDRIWDSVNSNIQDKSQRFSTFLNELSIAVPNANELSYEPPQHDEAGLGVCP